MGVAWLLLLALAQPPAAPPDAATAPPSPTKSPALDQLPLPPGAIVVVAEDTRQALQMAPVGSVVLSPERYQALMEAAAKGDKGPPRQDGLISLCRLSGQVVRDGSGATAREALELQIELTFRTAQPNAVVPVGLKGARLTRAALDGDTPLWGPERNGLTVQVKDPKVYVLTLGCTVPVTRSGTEHKVLIDKLPPAAITTLELTVPDRVTGATVKGVGPLAVQSQDGPRSLLRSEALGTVDQVEAAWQVGASAPAAPAGPAVAVTGDLRATLGEGAADTDARLRVEVRQGTLAQLRWKLGGAEAQLLHAEDEGRGEALAWEPDGPGQYLIKLKGSLAAGDPPLALRLKIQHRFPPRPGATVTLGQCELLDHKGAAQAGLLAVWLTPEVRGVRWQHQAMHRTDPREIPAGPDGKPPEVAYRYWRQPIKLDALIEPTPPAPPTVEVRAAHTVRLNAGALALASEFEVLRLSRPGIQELEVRWPAGFTPARRSWSGSGIDGVTEPAPGVLLVRLAARAVPPFKIKFEGSLPLTGLTQAGFALPAVARAVAERGDRRDLAQVVWREGELRLTADGVEVRPLAETAGLVAEGSRPPEPDLPLPGPVTWGLEPWSAEKPWHLALAWQPRRHEVQNAAAVSWNRREVHVVQTLRYQFTGPAPASLTLRLPRDLADTDRLELTYPGPDGQPVPVPLAWADRGKPGDGPTAERVLALPREVRGGCTFRLEYLRPLAAGPDETDVTLPLLRPNPGEVLADAVTVRVWASAGVRVAPPEAAPGWLAVTAPEALPGTDLLPVLVLRGGGGAGPLPLRLRRVAAAAFPAAAASRVLVEASGLDQERITVRVRAWITRLQADELTVRLPGLLSTLRLEHLRLDQEEVPASHRLLDDSGEAGPWARLTVPLAAQRLGQPILFDLRYQVAARVTAGGLRAVPVPELGERGDGAWSVGQVRWRVEWPADWLPLGFDGADPDQAWAWRGWFRPPEPALLADPLGRWIAPAPQDEEPPDEAPALSLGRTGTLGPLVFLSVPRGGWLLLCSLAVVVPGVLGACGSRRAAVVGLGLVGVTLVAAGVAAPGVWPAFLYGAQAAGVVLALVAAILWVRQQRWRRQVILMPGFRRRKTGSSLLRGQGSRPPREPSTVDGPAVGGRFGPEGASA